MPNNVSALREQYGDRVELFAEDGATLIYLIAAEMTVQGTQYAVLRQTSSKDEDDIEVFRVVAGPEGSVQLETVADDEEWELVAEAFDDSQFGSDDQP